jgi:hemerythrin-like domain-containing protein
MSSIAAFMTEDHRACDSQIASVEACVQQQQWADAAVAWRKFEQAMRCHFTREEQLLFPAFENATGNRQGPTAVMRMEHEQMRAMFATIDDAVRMQDKKRCLGMSDTLMVLMQQHNMKEEQILYPMCDRMVPEGGAMVAKLEALQPDQG